MSNERKNRVEDALVAETYKAVAQERAPDRLNKRMLRMAAREGRTPYSRARAWMRPAAWAATIALSLAIVLELTRLPQIEPESVDIAAPRQELEDTIDGAAKPRTPVAERPDPVSMDAFAPKDIALLREAKERARAQAGPDQAATAPRADADVAAAEAVPARNVAADEDVPARDIAAEQDTAEQVPAKRPSAEQDMAEQVPAKRLSAEQDMAAQIPAGRPSAEPAAGAASFSVAAEKETLESHFACPAKLRESAESWFACIERLRESGQEQLADSEYDEFHRIFPDFVESRADK